MADRLKPKDRKAAILASALKQARKYGYQNVDRGQISADADCSRNLINHYFGTMPQLRRAIIGEAIRLKDLTIIAQALVAREPRAMKLSDEVKQAALASVAP
jgi:AcrR family transcriptional regulator